MSTESQEIEGYAIGDVAELLGVSTRTLRHWDEVGVLSPEWRTSGDHRFYTDRDLQKGMDIMIYRGAGIALRDVAALIDAAPDDVVARLRQQKDLLRRRQEDVETMLSVVQNLIEKEEATMANNHILRRVSNFSEKWPGYQEEAGEKYGETTEWVQSSRVRGRMKSDDWEYVKSQAEKVLTLLQDAAEAEVQPGSEKAREVVDAHWESVAYWFEMTREKQVLIARGYVHDKRFDEFYGGHARYLLQLVEAEAESEGIDLEDVAWA